MATSASITAGYDVVARAYADQFLRELDDKPLDRALLGWFAEMVRGAGKVADLGCGPGHVARHLHERGVDAFGMDLSRGMVDRAREAHRDRGVDSRVGDFLEMDLPDSSLAGATAFYAYVHVGTAGLLRAFAELQRVLRPGAPALLAFHVGDETVHLDEFLGAGVDMDWRFLPTNAVVAALESAGLVVEMRLERAPYPREHPSTRGCVLARRT